MCWLSYHLFSKEILQFVIFGAAEVVVNDHNLDRLQFDVSGLRKVALRCLIMCLSGICSTEEIGWDNGAIDFYPLHFMFPQGKGMLFMMMMIIMVILITGTQKVNMLVEGQAEIKMFCKDYVQRAEVMFILATVSCMLVVLSLVHFLMALSANYAHIRGHDKFTDFQVNIPLHLIKSLKNCILV
jgi:hypothetical protein